MEEHLLDREDDRALPERQVPDADVCDWAVRALGVEVASHDRMQVSFLTALHGAGIEELRVIASTYEGLDAIAGTHRQAELGWKARAARAALSARTEDTGAQPG